MLNAKMLQRAKILQTTKQFINNFQTEFAESLKHLKAELENGVAYKKTCIFYHIVLLICYVLI